MSYNCANLNNEEAEYAKHINYVSPSHRTFQIPEKSIFDNYTTYNSVVDFVRIS